jgi:hypothetical protein
MLLIAEIILTIFAWRKGWKWLSLIPLGTGMFTGFLIGFAVGSSGGNLDAARGVGVLLDFVIIGVLIYMVIKGPKSTSGNENTLSQENK